MTVFVIKQPKTKAGFKCWQRTGSESEGMQ